MGRTGETSTQYAFPDGQSALMLVAAQPRSSMACYAVHALFKLNVNLHSQPAGVGKWASRTLGNRDTPATGPQAGYPVRGLHLVVQFKEENTPTRIPASRVIRQVVPER